jgi:molybdate-binding protein/transcriptional regulator with XRE-family HTH domain
MNGQLPPQVRRLREQRGLPQQALAAQVGLSRQGLSAIEAGRAVPGVDVALRLARALDVAVEELFPQAAAMLEVEAVDVRPGERLAVARLSGRWVAQPLGDDGLRVAADAIAVTGGDGPQWVEPLRSRTELAETVLLAGCAAALGLLADRLNTRAGPGRFVWLSRSSTAALQSLADELVHVAGVHLVDTHTGEANAADVRRLMPGGPVALVTLARWQVGLVVRRDATPCIGSAADLARPGIRVVGREAGAGAQRLLEQTLRAQGLAHPPQLCVRGHGEVARAVALGAADVGVASQDAALAAGLGFVPLAEERYDLAIPRPWLDDPRLLRLLDVMTSAPFRRELAALGYDTTPAGQQVLDGRAA